MVRETLTSSQARMPSSTPVRAPRRKRSGGVFPPFPKSTGIRDTTVLRAMELVPREIFAPRRFTDLARKDVALPLPCGQTMTVPRTVASMLVALGVEPHHRVLEIGTGSGYVTALLARLGRGVVSVERFGTLAEERRRHPRCGRHRRGVRIETGDGLAPRPRERFDRILVNGAAPAIPSSLASLLAPERAARRRPDDRRNSPSAPFRSDDPGRLARGARRGPAPLSAPCPESRRLCDDAKADRAGRPLASPDRIFRAVEGQSSAAATLA